MDKQKSIEFLLSGGVWGNPTSEQISFTESFNLAKEKWAKHKIKYNHHDMNEADPQMIGLVMMINERHKKMNIQEEMADRGFSDDSINSVLRGLGESEQVEAEQVEPDQYDLETVTFEMAFALGLYEFRSRKTDVVNLTEGDFDDLCAEISGKIAEVYQVEIDSDDMDTITSAVFAAASK